jgi:hypothetical protein
MTAVLIVTACLIGEPGTCQDYRLPSYEMMTVEACTFTAMPVLASWAAANPDKKIVSFRCRKEQEI